MQPRDHVPYYYGMNYDAPAGPEPPRPIGSLLGGAILQDQIGVDSGLWYSKIAGVPLGNFQIDFGGETRPGSSGYDREAGYTSYHTMPEAVGMLADSTVGDSVRSLMRVGKALTGDPNAYVVDEVNDPKTVALKQAQDVLEALSLYSGPGILAGKPVASGLSVFGGLGAKEAPVSMRKVAEVALAAGKHPEEVWKHTGWRIGQDKKWRFEIDDKAMKLLDPTREFQIKRLDEVIDHPELFKQYPELKEYTVQAQMNPGLQASGLFSHEQGMIKASGPSPESIKDTLVHEIQHWIQTKEGFALGGTSKSAWLGSLRKEAVKEYQKLLDYGDEVGVKKVPDWLDLELQKSAGENVYRRLHGEIESNDVIARRTWDKDMRREVFPTEREDAIIRFGKKDADEIYRELVR